VVIVISGLNAILATPEYWTSLASFWSLWFTHMNDERKKIKSAFPEHTEAEQGH
jgi:hypothetical protein